MQTILEIMKKLESVNKVLQADKIAIAYVRGFLDKIIDSFPTAPVRLNPNANIVHRPNSESAVDKVQLA